MQYQCKCTHISPPWARCNCTHTHARTPTAQMHFPLSVVNVTSNWVYIIEITHSEEKSIVFPLHMNRLCYGDGILPIGTILRTTYKNVMPLAYSIAFTTYQANTNIHSLDLQILKHCQLIVSKFGWNVWVCVCVLSTFANLQWPEMFDNIASMIQSVKQTRTNGQKWYSSKPKNAHKFVFNHVFFFSRVAYRQCAIYEIQASTHTHTLYIFYIQTDEKFEKKKWRKKK